MHGQVLVMRSSVHGTVDEASYLHFDVKTTGTSQVGLFNETFSEYVSTSVESRQDVLLLIVQTV